MDNLISEYLLSPNVESTLTILDLIAALGVSLVLTLILAKLYLYTHSGVSYSRSFTISLVLVGVTISLIMIIIGSNIARAFALVGAMSIVRFRNPVKDSRDLVFVFMAIAIGIASGTQFYSFAVIFTLFVSATVFALNATNFGNIKSQVYVLRITRTSSVSDRKSTEDIFQKFCTKYFVVSMDKLANQADVEEVVYEVNLRKRKNYADLVAELSSSAPNTSVSLLVGDNNVDA